MTSAKAPKRPPADKTRRPPKRAWKTQSLAESLSRITRDLCAAQGFAQAEIITRWRAIVGPDLADHCMPDKLTFPKGQDSGTLHILSSGSFALTLQHLEPQVIARINGYFGFPAVSRITIRQAPLPIPARRRRQKPRPDAKDAAEARTTVSGLRDPHLRQALQSLGEMVISSDRKDAAR